jgi:hypothetical protein
MEAIADPPVGQSRVLRTYFPARIEGGGDHLRLAGKSLQNIAKPE